MALLQKSESDQDYFFARFLKKKVGKTVKRNVQLDGIELRAIKIKPFTLRQALRVKNFLPVLVMKAGASNPPVNHNFSLRLTGIQYWSHGVLTFAFLLTFSLLSSRMSPYPFL
ncbi:MAG: hypothetical protein WKF97_24120 [Chitinophagaceae bacterium]